MRMGWRPHMNSVAYAATTLGAGMMNHVFSFYYVKVYLNHYQVSESWFQFSQVIFMVWNAVNDPLFGYIQDNFSFSWVKSRRHSILYGAPFYMMAFVLPWFPWDPSGQHPWLSGLQLLVSLCFFDTLLTFVLLAQCALFTEMSGKHEDRLRLVCYTQYASFLGSWVIFFTESMSSNLHDFGGFQRACCFIGILGFVFLTYSGMNAYTEYDTASQAAATANRNEALLGIDVKDEKAKIQPRVESPYTVWQQIWQIMTQRSFVVFVLVNFFQVYHSTFYANFMAIFCDQLVSKEFLSSGGRSIFYGSIAYVSQIMVIMASPMVSRFGYYKVIRCSFVFNIVAGIAMYTLGLHAPFIIVFFLLMNGVTHATFSLYNLCLSDIIDVDVGKFKRSRPLSSMVFGTNALITKPAQSVSPMFTVALLNRYGYEELRRTLRPAGIAAVGAISSATPSALAAASFAPLNEVMFLVLCFTPVMVGIAQLLIWSFYTIRNSHVIAAKYVET